MRIGAGVLVVGLGLVLLAGCAADAAPAPDAGAGGDVTADGAAGADGARDDGSGPAADADADAATDAGPDVPPATCAVTGFGPHGVGLRTRPLVDAARGDRPLPTLLYYPTDTPAAWDACWAAFLAAPVLTRLQQAAVCAVADAPPAGGPWPLVVISHGDGGNKEAHAFEAEFLASHGFVVAVPDHTGNVGFAGIGPDDLDMTLTRGRDVTFVLDAVLAAAGDGSSGVAIAPQRCGVAGHSWGGHTALTVAGLDYSWDVLQGWCDAGTEPDVWDCAILDNRAEFEAEFPDERVRAVVTWAHDAGHNVAAPACAGAAGVAVPWLQLLGDDDPYVRVDEDGRDCYDRAAGPACLAILPGAGHLGFSAFGDEGTFGAERLFDLVRWYSAAFFRWHLAGEPACEAALLDLAAPGDHEARCRPAP